MIQFSLKSSSSQRQAAMPRLPSSAISRRLHAAWHEEVAGELGQQTASTTGVAGAASPPKTARPVRAKPATPINVQRT
jgi:hypothetical protein